MVADAKHDVMIRVEKLGKYFVDKKKDREIRALDGISFEVRRGEIFGFLGPNGAGKTTTIRVLAGLLQPTFGTAWVDGLDVLERAVDIRKRIGFLTENHGSYEELSVEQNLQFFGGYYGLEDLDARIDEVLAQLKLGDRKKMKVGKLSKGLKQRAALARVLVHDPKVLFLDEPTSGLDPVAAVQVRGLIRTLKSKNRTIFINSHNLEEVQKVCDRVAIIDRGRLKRVGTAAELGQTLWEAQEVVCTLAPPVPAGLCEALQALDGVKSCLAGAATGAAPGSGAGPDLPRAELPSRERHSLVRVQLERIDEVTPRIAEVLVERGARILEIKRRKHSLEDIYLRLMSTDDETGALTDAPDGERNHEGAVA